MTFPGPDNGLPREQESARTELDPFLISLHTDYGIAPEHLYHLSQLREFDQFKEAARHIKDDLDEDPENRTGGTLVLDGPMRSGKTLSAVALAHMLADKHIAVAKPTADTRDTTMRSNSGLEIPCSIRFNGDLSEYEAELLEADALFLDELHFSPHQLPYILQIVETRRELGKWTVISGLDKDFAGRPMAYPRFEGDTNPITSEDIEGIATEHIRMTADCDRCSEPATHSMRTVDRFDGKGYWPAYSDDPIRLPEGEGVADYCAHCSECHCMADELTADDETLRGSNFLDELETALEVLTTAEQKPWEAVEVTYETWKRGCMMRWRAISEQDPTILTRFEVAELIRLFNIFELRTQTMELIDEVTEEEPDFAIKQFSVEGGVGVGKTTLVDAMRGEFYLLPAEEDVELNRWLVASNSKDDPQMVKDSAFTSQLHFRLSKLEQMMRRSHQIAWMRKHFPDMPIPALGLDRGLEGDNVFITEFVEKDGITVTDSILLANISQAVLSGMPFEEYTIHLTAVDDKIIQRVTDRGRPYELANMERQVDMNRRMLSHFRRQQQRGMLNGHYAEIDTSELTPLEVFQQMRAEIGDKLPVRPAA